MGVKSTGWPRHRGAGLLPATAADGPERRLGDRPRHLPRHNRPRRTLRRRGLRRLSGQCHAADDLPDAATKKMIRSGRNTPLVEHGDRGHPRRYSRGSAQVDCRRTPVSSRTASHAACQAAIVVAYQTRRWSADVDAAAAVPRRARAVAYAIRRRVALVGHARRRVCSTDDAARRMLCRCQWQLKTALQQMGNLQLPLTAVREHD